MKVRFLSPAQTELREAIEYYDHEHPGLGQRFLSEVDAVIGRVCLAPHGWTRLGQYGRRCLLKSFPYALLYVPEQDEIVVVAVMHLRRNPLRYLDRQG